MSRTSSVEAWQREFIPLAACKHCHHDNLELSEYKDLRGIFCEDCAFMHIHNEEERLSTCCGRAAHEDIDGMCGDCHEMANFECVRCEG